MELSKKLRRMKQDAGLLKFILPVMVAGVIGHVYAGDCATGKVGGNERGEECYVRWLSSSRPVPAKSAVRAMGGGRSRGWKTAYPNPGAKKPENRPL